MKKHYITKKAGETRKIGQELAKKILERGRKKKGAQVLALLGELGGGKTTFLQGFARGLGIKERILSPTFLIQKKFELKDKPFKYFYHIDCYRIEKEKELLDLGFKELISNPYHIIAIEWADRVRGVLPPNLISISFQLYNEDKREINLEWKRKKRG